MDQHRKINYSIQDDELQESYLDVVISVVVDHALDFIDINMSNVGQVSSFVGFNCELKYHITSSLEKGQVLQKN